jgi:aminoglycoside 3-N-acetyltransferase
MNKDDIVKGLRWLGVRKGDIVMVHSSLSSFGQVDGGAKTVVLSLLEAIGQQGTLVVPTFSHYLSQNEKVWDREHTPSLMGSISETVRTWPGSIRSNHAAHPLAAIGQKAKDLCAKPYKTGTGPDSPFQLLVEMNASILLMGVDYSRCTIFHLLEAAAKVPYRYLEERKAVTIIDGMKNENGSAWEYTRTEGTYNDFMPFGRLLEEQGIVIKIHTIGSSVNRLFKAGDMYRLGMKILTQDPYFLLDKNSKNITSSKY